MKKAIVGLAALGLLAGCGGQKSSYTASAGSVALSRDGKLVYAVDTDNDALEVATAPDGTKVAEVKVGHGPVRVLVGADERIYVSNRGERTVSVLQKDGFKELARIPVGVEPNGLAFDANGQNLLVVSATDLDDASHGTLTAVDVKSLKPAWSIPVGEEPRGVTVVGNKAYVTQLKKGTVTVVDLMQHQVASAVDLSSPDSPDPISNPNAMDPGGVADITASPDGTRVYAAHLWELKGNIETSRGLTSTSSGSYGSSGPCQSGGSIVAAGIATIETKADQPKTDSLSTCQDPGSPDSPTDPNSGQPKDFPPSLMPSAGMDQHVVQGPVASVVDPSGLWLFVVNRNSNNVVVMPTMRRMLPDGSGSRIVVDVGAAPDGIALSQDGKTAYVYSQFDHTLSIIKQGSDAHSLVESERVLLAKDTLSPDEAEGRRMFFSAVDTRMTAQNIGIACASCHLEGREDGHVWMFPDGPRQTPDLAGRKLQETAPYHWAGLFPTLNEFYRETVIGRMGGQGLQDAEADRVTKFIESMPPPENPFQGRPDLLAAQQRGKLAFAKAGCVACHTGDAMTDNSLHDVGTLSSLDRLEILSNGIEDHSADFPQLQAVNTPSLIGLARTAPYLHDGSVTTLRGRLVQAQADNRHGDTSALNTQELDDLEQYLRSL